MFVNVTYHRLLVLIILWFLPLIAQAAGLQQVLDELLDKADADVLADRLMTPINDNAYDRYQAVLLLDNNNQRALLGLRSIAARYQQMARLNLKRGNFSRARALLDNAITANGQNALTRKLAGDIRSAELSAQRQPVVALSIPPVVVDAEQTVFDLNPKQLSERNSEVISQLLALGQRVQDTREYVLIYARNDSEGRWIYQQMRKAGNSYRLRGNIKRDKTPRVVLEPPLD